MSLMVLRDVHAAKNVKLFGLTKRAECLEQASVETLASAALELSNVSKLSRRSENEDSSLKAGISSLLNGNLHKEGFSF